MHALRISVATTVVFAIVIAPLFLGNVAMSLYGAFAVSATILAFWCLDGFLTVEIDRLNSARRKQH
jgi:hypothetical protein